MVKEFKEFISRGSVLDMAVGIIIGGAFGAIIASFVGDVLMPVIGSLFKADFSNIFLLLKEGTTPAPYATLAAAKAAGAVTMNVGLFVNALVNFLIIAFAIFMVVKAANRMKREQKAAPEAPATKDCPRCFTAIPVKASRCPNCTSDI
jgi:large conductance mechanosensitive channel